MTIEYYNQHADTFVKSTLNVNMQALYKPFVSLLAENALILDAGCGSGRDTKAFIDMGYRVEAFDASEAMAEYATSYTGIKVLKKQFLEVRDIARYDAIWTCASLLHVSRKELPLVIEILARALKKGGIWYLSFKYGSTERLKDGRTFTDMDEECLESLLSYQPELKVFDMWCTEDARPEREERWINVLLVKQSRF